ncbi:MAG: PAS domain S-box protein [Methanomicrobiaceae archaeon]|nr:PAS domain S-box protein [Methanomicrobiaceae archaeon]
MPDTIRVLYVDDEPALLDIARLFLEKEGTFAVDTLTSATEALTCIPTEQYDAIISDYLMPDMDGIEFLQQVRRSGNGIPFILFTGRGREEVVIEAINSGADFYIQKGGDPKSQFAELGHKIRQAVKRSRAERSRIESEKRLADIIDFLPDATFAIDRDGIIIAWNRAIEEMTGFSAESMIGKGDYEYAIPFYGTRRPILIDLLAESDETVSRFYSRITRTPDTLTAETNLPHPKGTRIAVLAKAGPLYNRQGERVGAIESIREITDRKMAEDELHAAYEQLAASQAELRRHYEDLVLSDQRICESEEKYRTLVEVNHDIIFSLALDGTVLYASPQVHEQLGYLPEEIEGTSFTRYVHPGDVETLVRHIGEHFRERRVASPDTFRMLRNDGMYRWFEDRTMYTTGPNGRPIVIGTIRDITDQKAAEDALRESEERYRTIIDSIQDVFYRSDRSGNLIMASPSFAATLGYPSLGDCIGKPAGCFWMYPERRQAFLSELEAKGSVTDYDVVLKKADGTPIIVSTSSHYYSTPDGTVAGVEGIFHDVTAIREAQQQATLLAALNDISPASVVVHTPEGEMLYANQRTFDLHGWTKEEFMALNLHQLDVPASEVLIARRVEELQRTGEASFDVEHFRKDGSSFPLHVMTKITRWNDRDVIMSVAMDISDLKKTEIAIRESEERFRRLIASSFDAVVVHQDGAIVLANDAAARLAGAASGSDLCGRSLIDFVHPAFRGLVAERVRQVLGSPEQIASPLEEQFLRLDGSAVDVEAMATATRYDGRPAIMVVFRDISQRKQTENALQSAYEDLAASEEELRSQLEELALSRDRLRESEEKFRALVETTSDVIWEVDASGTYTYASPNVRAILGYGPEELIGRSAFAIMPPDEAKRIASAFARHAGLRRPITLMENRCIHKDGSVVVLETSGVPHLAPDGSLVGYRGIDRDISERKMMEHAIREANRKLNLLNSITRHDMGNQLAVIQGYAEIIARSNPVPEIAGMLAKIDDAVRRIVSQIEFARTYQELGVKAPAWFSIGDIVATADGKGVRFSCTCDGIAVFADPMLQRVFSNLFDNAIRHGEHTTTITVRCEPAGDGLAVIVEDDGIGIPAGEKEKIFERGYGKHTGLGLFLTREILAITGITIAETGEFGKGARFVMTVPAGGFRISP